ncbi:hypothetical protein Ancab_031190 [Ancistrocladus abbreviatus]
MTPVAVQRLIEGILLRGSAFSQTFFKNKNSSTFKASTSPSQHQIQPPPPPLKTYPRWGLRPFLKFAAIPDTEDLDAPKDGLAIIENVVSSRLEPLRKELLSSHDEGASSSENVAAGDLLNRRCSYGIQLAVAEEFGLRHRCWTRLVLVVSGRICIIVDR